MKRPKPPAHHIAIYGPFVSLLPFNTGDGATQRIYARAEPAGLMHLRNLTMGADFEQELRHIFSKLPTGWELRVSPKQKPILTFNMTVDPASGVSRTYPGFVARGFVSQFTNAKTLYALSVADQDVIFEETDPIHINWAPGSGPGPRDRDEPPTEWDRMRDFFFPKRRGSYLMNLKSWGR